MVLPSANVMTCRPVPPFLKPNRMAVLAPLPSPAPCTPVAIGSPGPSLKVILRALDVLCTTRPSITAAGGWLDMIRTIVPSAPDSHGSLTVGDLAHSVRSKLEHVIGDAR